MLSNSAYIIGMTSLPCLAARIFHDNPSITIDKKLEREFGAYDGIADNYPKYVLSMDKFDMSRNGIIHQNIIDFLLEK